MTPEQRETLTKFERWYRLAHAPLTKGQERVMDALRAALRAPAVTGEADTMPRCKMRHRVDGAIYICTREVDHPGEHRSGTARSWPAAPPAVAGGDALCLACDGDGYTEVEFHTTCKACRGTGRRRQEGQ